MRAASRPLEQAHSRELVLGPVPGSDATAGPWVELSSLSLDQLASIDPASVASAPPGLDLHAEAITSRLRGLALPDRTALWHSLVTAASAKSAKGGSGEIGFATRYQLVKAVGDAVFADGVKTGDVVGPIATDSGPELFFVEARYAGPLDKTSEAEIEEVHAEAAPDLATWTKRLSPADVALAADAGWRAQAEFASDDPAKAALFDTPAGTLSDPFVLHGKLVMVEVDQRRSGSADARMLDRLRLGGYDAWFASERARATVSLNPNPLPELATPTAAASGSALPTDTATSAPPPTMPGLPVATPLKTDSFGLPALP